MKKLYIKLIHSSPNVSPSPFRTYITQHPLCIALEFQDWSSNKCHNCELSDHLLKWYFTLVYHANDFGFDIISGNLFIIPH